MSLNIKNPETHDLARRLARLTGENLTEAVTQALRERLDRERRRRTVDRRVRRVMALVAGLGPKGDARAVDHGALLYDETGLPR